MLEFDHLVAKVIARLAESQYEKFGDGTTSVVLVVAELLPVLY